MSIYCVQVIVRVRLKRYKNIACVREKISQVNCGLGSSQNTLWSASQIGKRVLKENEKKSLTQNCTYKILSYVREN